VYVVLLIVCCAQVRAYGDHGHTLYVMDSNGQPPDPRKVQSACQAGGGQLQGPLEGLPLGVSPSAVNVMGAAAAVVGSKAAAGQAEAGGVVPGAGAKFFYMLQQRVWDGSPSSFASL
jgi:hypothetical protein